MAKTSLIEIEPPNPSDPPSSITPLTRKFVFIPVKSPFKGFSNDFHIETLNPTSSEPGSSASLAPPKKHDTSEFSEYGLDPGLSFRISFRRIGAGLRNLGNTCFLNSVLQCLTYTEPLVAYLQSGKHKTSCHIAGFCALCEIQKHVSRALQSTGRILAPDDLVGNLRWSDCLEITSKSERYLAGEAGVYVIAKRMISKSENTVTNLELFRGCGCSLNLTLWMKIMQQTHETSFN